jgi:hypothetical protein
MALVAQFRSLRASLDEATHTARVKVADAAAARYELWHTRIQSQRSRTSKKH